ncbi:hypothetical protein Tco_1522949 [Tanacetum coccineum]
MEEDDSSISSSDEEDSDNDVEGANVASAKSDEDATDEKDQGNEAVKDTNTNLDGRDKVMTDVFDDFCILFEGHHVGTLMDPNSVNPDGQQQSSSVSLDSSQKPMLNKTRYGVEIFLKNILKATSLNDYFCSCHSWNHPSCTTQTNQYDEALSSIPSTVDQYLAHKMQEAVDVVVQLKYDRIQEESTTANQQFLETIDDGMKKIIKNKVN